MNLVYSERSDLRAQLLAAARGLAGVEPVTSVLLRGGEEDAAAEMAAGADVVAIATPALDDASDGERVTAVVAEAVAALEPETVLIGSTRMGVEVCARLAQRLGVASATEGQDVRRRAEDGALLVDRYVYGGRFVARQALLGRPHVAAVQANRFEPLAPDPLRTGSVHELPVAPAPTRVRRVGVREREHSPGDIGRADVVVTAGRGVRAREDLAILESLAQALGGELAGSRPLVERGWFPLDRQVGLSGRTVSPGLYVACGVSGQIEHIAGMRSARTVVAIDTNPEAPIHREADYSVVGDVYEVVPALVAAVEQARRTSGERA